LVQGGTFAPMGFASYHTLSQMLGETGQAEYMMVVTEEHSLEAQTRMSRLIEESLTGAGFRVSLVAPAELDKQTIASIFYILSALLVIIAVVLALVGGLGLMGTMSINVLERTREIGVMRAVGAATRSILKIILWEGIFIGVLSWLGGTLIALPLSKFISDTVGQLFLSSSLTYRFSIEGMLGWLILVTLLALIASFLPAWNASRLTVREVLAYE
jgi:putative ABC transport system permease protein